MIISIDFSLVLCFDHQRSKFNISLVVSFLLYNVVRSVEARSGKSPAEEQVDCLVDDARATNGRCWCAGDVVGTLCSLVRHLRQWSRSTHRNTAKRIESNQFGEIVRWMACPSARVYLPISFDILLVDDAGIFAISYADHNAVGQNAFVIIQCFVTFETGGEA